MTTYHCGNGTCPGFPDEHHELDCPDFPTSHVAHLRHVAGRIPGGRYTLLERLDMLTEVIESAERVRETYVTQARAAGHSWTEIGNAIGRTKQATQQRYGLKMIPTPSDPEQMRLVD